MITEEVQKPKIDFKKNLPSVNYKVRLPEFEGPLDLLLHLIKTHEMNIEDLQVAKITKQYLEYLDFMRNINIDVASDYLLMAATLTYIKSQALVPKEEKSLDESTGNDPRAQLIRKLQELKNYKSLAENLKSRPRLFREIFPSQNNIFNEVEDLIDPEISLTNPFQLIDSYQKMLARKKGMEHQVFNDEVPIKESLKIMISKLKSSDEIHLRNLLSKPYTIPQLISMFLATLESAKMQIVKIIQDKNYGPILIKRKMTSEEIEQRTKSLQEKLSWE